MDEPEHVAIRREPVMVVLLDLVAADGKRHGETAESTAALEHGGHRAACAQPLGRGEAGIAAADHRHAKWRRAIGPFRHGSRS